MLIHFSRSIPSVNDSTLVGLFSSNDTCNAHLLGRRPSTLEFIFRLEYLGVLRPLPVFIPFSSRRPIVCYVPADEMQLLFVRNFNYTLTGFKIGNIVDVNAPPCYYCRRPSLRRHRWRCSPPPAAESARPQAKRPPQPQCPLRPRQ